MMKAHIAAIAIILLLGIAISSFLFLVKNKSEEKGRALLKEKFSNYLVDELEYAMAIACERGSYKLVFESPAIVKLEGEGKTLCVENSCVEIELEKIGENCSIGRINTTLYKQKYEISINRDSKLSMEVRLWH